MSVLNETELAQLVKKLCRKKGITIADIQEDFEISRRTAYRWIDELLERGFKITKDATRPVTYYIETA